MIVQCQLQLGALGHVSGRYTKLFPPTAPGRVWYRLGECALEDGLGRCRRPDERASLHIVGTGGRVGVFITGPGGIAAGVLGVRKGIEPWTGESLVCHSILSLDTVCKLLRGS